MFDDFFNRALIAGFGLALVAGPMGCFIVWRRMAYFGDTLAHSALLGLALALLFQINIMVSVFVVAASVSLLMLSLSRRAQLSSDALLGILSHSTLAIGLVALAFMTWVRVDLSGLLFGDILAVSRTDLAIIWIGGALVLGALLYIWRPLFAATVNAEMATAEGLPTDKANIAFVLLMAAFIAIAMKIVGVLLITAMLIIPAATARRVASTPEHMALLAAIIGVAAVGLGLFGSLQFDTPSGPSIVVAALIGFLLSVMPLRRSVS